MDSTHSQPSHGLWPNARPDVVLALLTLWGAASALLLALVTHLVAADANTIVLELFDRVELIIAVTTSASLVGLMVVTFGRLRVIWRTGGKVVATGHLADVPSGARFVRLAGEPEMRMVGSSRVFIRSTAPGGRATCAA